MRVRPWKRDLLELLILACTGILFGLAVVVLVSWFRHVGLVVSAPR